MAQEALEQLGKEAGIKAEPGEEKTRTVKRENVKTMSKEKLQKELGASRKQGDKLTARVLKLEGAGHAEQMPTLPPELWGAFPAMIYDYLSMRFGPHWKLSDREVILYGSHIAAVANRYLPDYAGKHPELLMLTICVLSTTFPRVMITVKGRIAPVPSKPEKEKKEKPVKKNAK